MQKPRGSWLARAGFLKINLAIPTFALVGTIIGPESLTAVFGMGTGVSFPVWSPEETRSTVRCCGPGFDLVLVARAAANVRCKMFDIRCQNSIPTSSISHHTTYIAPLFCPLLVSARCEHRAQ